MEFVYVVPRSALFPQCAPHGLALFGEHLERAAFEATLRREGFFVERTRAERTPDWKQVIPYTLVARGGELLCVRRLARGGERRLHGKLSIGIGGHLEPQDLDGAEGERDPLPRGTWREIREELHVEGATELRAVGLLNDDSNPVGAVHVGVVQVLTAEGSVRVREEDALDGRLLPPAELRRLAAEGADFESWSRVLLGRVEELCPELQALPT
jgi:predicted NUDIX family phosphoesterase